MELKTEALNDKNFEVTEAWLLEFAGLHAEYMEQATARSSGVNHEFRSTNDLFHHVLQHASVLKLIGNGYIGKPGNISVLAAIESSKPSTTCLDVPGPWSPASTEIPT